MGRVSARAIDLPRPRRRVRLAAALDEHGLTIAATALAAALLLVLAAAAGMVGDSWLGLVAGREVAQHGLPAHDQLAVVTSGRRWVDQQWLGQLGVYELQRATGEYFTLVLACLAAIPALLGSIAFGRRGSTDRAVAAVVALSSLPFLGAAALARTQSLAYPLFVALLVLLGRRQTWTTRVASLGLIALWANLHGSVLLGAGAASLRFLQDARSHRARTMLLVGSTWLATLCSPYALDLPAYYRSTVANSVFAEVLTQWKPLGISARALPTLLLVVAVVWLVARSRRRLWTFEPALLLALVVLTVHSVRTAPFLALAALALLPRLTARSRPERSEGVVRARLAVAAIAMGALIAAAAVTHVRFSPLAPDAAAAVAGAGDGKVFVPLELGDWLLWNEPAMRGRVAADARAELLTASELRRFAGLWRGAAGWRTLTAGYRSFVLSPTDERWLVRRLVSRPTRFRVVYRDEKIVVLARRGH
jgi:hypothetical protein